MTAKFDTKELKQFAKNLTKMPNGLINELGPTVEECSKVVKKAAQELVAVDTGVLKKNIKIYKGKKTKLSYDCHVGIRRRNKAGYGIPLEFGTKKPKLNRSCDLQRTKRVKPLIIC